MSNANLGDQPLRQLVADIIRGDDFCRATFGGTRRRDSACPWLRVVVQPVELRGQRLLQFSYFEQKKNITQNYPPSEVGEPLRELLDVGFAGIHLSTASEEIDIQTTKKGKIIVGRKKVDARPVEVAAHNRIKDVPLPEGQSNHLLEVMGILTRTGQVRPTMRAKFTQINEFLKQLTHILDEGELRGLGRPVEILDCGCGSSYLTLAVHHYLKDVLNLPARIVGVDVNEEVIRKSIERSERLGAERLSFACQSIGAMEVKPDIVLALHACDTATDDAIAQAINTQAKILLSVPCCHHYLNDQLTATGSAEVLRPLLRHGILQQRTADLVTDAFRALVLRIMGYRTEVVEFISAEHTARNLMIRAVRCLPIGDPALVAEYLALRRFWSVTPYIEQVLGEGLYRVLSEVSQ